MLDYGVSGIPHFVFLDDKGQSLGAAVGKVPKQVLTGGQPGAGWTRCEGVSGVRGV